MSTTSSPVSKRSLAQHARALPIHPAWLTIWLIIYASFLILGLFWPEGLPVTIIKMLGIFLCVIFVFVNYRKDVLLQLALLFTFAADLILAANHTAPAGVLVFCGTQLAHFMRLTRGSPITKVWLFAALIIAAAGAIVPENIGIYFYAGVYAFTLLVNLILSIAWYRRAPSARALSAMIGFILFIACDLHVAASYATTIGVLPAEIYGFANYLAWVFYFPSQICLAHSSRLVVK